MISLIISCVLLAHCLADDILNPSAADPEKPNGSYYCQARCLASCLETFLAPTLEDCDKFCPPFDDKPPCTAADSECWKTCGIPPGDSDPSPPAPVTFLPSEDPTVQKEQDPFLIDLAWTAVPDALLYIVEFYPVDRKPKPGENNFFRTMTTSLSYTVRKEDECVSYDARVIAVNSYGISDPTRTHVGAPVPKYVTIARDPFIPELTYTPYEHFTILNMQRDAWSENMISVTIDYTFPTGWPADDIDLDLIRVTASDCRGLLGAKTFGSDSNTNAELTSDVLNPAYNALIGKSPTTAIQLSFFDDVLRSNCMFHVMVLSVVSRCNTSSVYEAVPGTAPGISFRLNCDSVTGACDNETDAAQIAPEPPAPIPVPDYGDEMTEISTTPDAINLPSHLPPGVEEPDTSAISSADLSPLDITVPTSSPVVTSEDDLVNSDVDWALQFNFTDETDLDTMPTPPPLPEAMVEASQTDAEVPNQQPAPPGISFSVIDLSGNGTDAQTVEIIPEMLAAPMCELDMVDVQPSLNALSPSLIDLTITWLEHQMLPPLPPASYFTIRYGPLIRQLVVDERTPLEIIPGYETFVRTGGDPVVTFDPTRTINATGIQRNSLIKLQICAIYDPNSEPMISWDLVPSRTIDLAALEPFLDLDDQVAAQTVAPIPSDMLPPPDFPDLPLAPAPSDLDFGFGPPIGVEPPIDPPDEPMVPLVIAVEVADKKPDTIYYLSILAGILMVVFTAWLVFACLRRTTGGRRKCGLDKQKAIVFVNSPQTQIPSPVSPDVKIPIV